MTWTEKTDRLMNVQSIEESYKILNVSPGASDDEIVRSYKVLAMRYHPDKNHDKVEWATGVMSRINEAYSTVMSARFRSETPTDQSPAQEQSDEERSYEESLRRRKNFERQRVDDVLREASINTFVRIRENSKEALYQFFQYSLFNIARRESIQNMHTYNNVVLSLRKSYHAIAELLKAAKDPEVVDHLTVFGDMIFNFYRAAECLNIPDSYENTADAEAFRLYRKGEDYLHASHREIFYDRHNRGSFEMETAVLNAAEARRRFVETIDKYPDSSWTVEARIKLDYTESLLRYLELFFSEE
jgi:curved DNA-binding protein CbpA